MPRYDERYVDDGVITLIDDKERPYYLRIDEDTYLSIDRDTRDVRDYWREYHRGRYDFNMSFKRFLDEQGMATKYAPLPKDLRYIRSVKTPQN